MLYAQRELLLALGVAFGACRAAPQPGPATDSPSSGVQSLERPSGRQLQGRFLHITDFHPDPFYKTYSSTEADAACHRGRGPAGVYGGETSGCDSPVSLINATFKWIDENLRDSIDFIIWTGDSARHDNDEGIPRTQKQVIVQNELLVTKFTEVFGTSNKNDDANAQHGFEIPIVPTFGNNDIMPHNIFLSGPNKWTSKYLDIWKNFIPEAQRHQFQQGGWFHVEVIPGKLAVISLNTLYFFDSNSGVDGCADKHEPGYEHMEWLRIQLTILRERGIKVMLMGHVPPARTDTKASWDETCWQKYALIQQNFRDIIVASLYGHMNIDHFMIHDFKDIKKDTKKGRMASDPSSQSAEVRDSIFEDGEVTVASAADYLLDLGNAWAKLPSPPKSKNSKSKSMTDHIDTDTDEEDDISVWQWVLNQISMSKKSKKGSKGDKDGKDRKGGKGGPGKKKTYLEKIGGRYAERFSVAHVSPSVVPNYFPTLRVFEYNITGLENTILLPTQSPPLDRTDPSARQLPIEYSDVSHNEDWIQDVKDIVEMKKRKKAHEAKMKRPKKYKFKVPPPPDKSAPPGPAYLPQTFTLKGYTQYFANLTHINNDFVAQSHSAGNEAHDNTTIFGLEVEDGQIEPQRWKEGKHKNHQGKKPKNKPHPKKFKFEVEYNTTHGNLFKLKDLTVRSYVDLARRIGRDKMGKKILGVEEEEYVIEDMTELEDEEEARRGSNKHEDTGIKTKKKKEGRKGGKKHKKKHHKKHKHDGPWYTFVRRAFVSTMDPHEIEEAFGQGGVAEEGPEEIMEL